MKYKSNLQKLFKVGFVLLLVYVMLIVSNLFVFSNKLTDDELLVVTEYYNEIRPVNKDIKNDFYVDTLLKVLDKQYILEELRRDSLLYSVYAVETSFNLFADGLNKDTAIDYLSRCYIDFDTFVGLETPTELFELTLSFFRGSMQNVEDFTTFGNFMDDIVSNEYAYLAEVSESRQTRTMWVVGSYILLTVILYFIDFDKIKQIVRGIKK